MKKYRILIILFFTGLLVSGIAPHDYFTWFLEVFPAIIGFFVLLFTFKKLQFSTLTYCFILIHCYILFIGGHFTYAEVPLFDWIRDVFHQSRNNYDKVGHFIQGFVPAMIVRELFIRRSIVKAGGWLSFLTVCVCITISVLYEFLEWMVAILSGQSADSFLGTQGYVWDTQSDMLYATIGAICMLLSLSRIQDRQIIRLNENKQTGRISSSGQKQTRREIQEINAGAVIIPTGSKRTSKYSEKYKKGNAFLHEQRYDEAIGIFSELSEIPEETETAMVSLGTSYNLKGETEKAGKCYGRALEINPENYNALLGMASFNYKSKQYANAVVFYRKANALRPDLPDAYWGLACAYHMMNEKQMASDNAKIFVNMEPNSRYRPQLEKMIIN